MERKSLGVRLCEGIYAAGGSARMKRRKRILSNLAGGCFEVMNRGYWVSGEPRCSFWPIAADVFTGRPTKESSGK